MDNKKEYILCAAIWYNDGIRRSFNPSPFESGLFLFGHRHSDCILTLQSIYPDYSNHRIDKGFLTNYKNFVSRHQAAKIAYECGQTEKDEELLTSEHLY